MSTPMSGRPDTPPEEVPEEPGDGAGEAPGILRQRSRLIEGDAPAGKARHHGGKVFAKQLDIKHGEDTLGCLHSLVTIMVLKNPIYSSIVQLLRKVKKDQMKEIETNIALILDKYDLERDLGIDICEIAKMVKPKCESINECNEEDEEFEHYALSVPSDSLSPTSGVEGSKKKWG